jgi:hypothetical protein
VYAVGTDFFAAGAKSWLCCVAALYQILLLGKCEKRPFGAVDVRLTALAKCVCAPHFNCGAFNPKVYVLCSLCEIKECNLSSPEDLCSSIFVFEIFICSAREGLFSFVESAF